MEGLLILMFVGGILSYMIPRSILNSERYQRKLKSKYPMEEKVAMIREAFLYETMKVKNDEKCIDDVYERIMELKQNYSEMNIDAK